MQPITASDDQARAFLVRYACPVAFLAVRTRCLGNIASSGIGISPIKMIASLWGGKLPEFDTKDAVNELIGALFMGLWNQLTKHQDRNAPFRLTRSSIAPTREGLATLALVRRQELDGFVEGLFGQEEIVDVPERAHRALDDLADMRALFAAAAELATDETKPAQLKEMETTLRLLREMTKNAEHEMHAIVLSCKRARKLMLAGIPAKKPTIH